MRVLVTDLSNVLLRLTGAAHYVHKHAVLQVRVALHMQLSSGLAERGNLLH